MILWRDHEAALGCAEPPRMNEVAALVPSAANSSDALHRGHFACVGTTQSYCKCDRPNCHRPRERFMKIPARRLLSLAAGAAALSMLSSVVAAQPVIINSDPGKGITVYHPSGSSAYVEFRLNSPLWVEQTTGPYANAVSGFCAANTGCGPQDILTMNQAPWGKPENQWGQPINWFSSSTGAHDGPRPRHLRTVDQGRRR